jgi:ABC-2 type transport system ATP-binding protein
MYSAPSVSPAARDPGRGDRVPRLGGRLAFLPWPAGAGTLGYCPQDPVLNDNLTVEAHLRYFAAARRLPSLHRAGDLVRRLGYEPFLGQAAGELSGGTRQKLNLTLALAHDPGVLLLDEPYQGFDWETYLRF